MKSKISNIRDGVATRLREARELLGLKQAELATLTAISRSTQIAYEKGTTEPTTGYLQAAQRAGLDIDAVLFGPRKRLIMRLLPQRADNLTGYSSKSAATQWTSSVYALRRPVRPAIAGS
ncbi:helix-turn-helix domain-containing protein [Delftia tsuruhatensis]